jgi:hypothetical protein
VFALLSSSRVNGAWLPLSAVEIAAFCLYDLDVDALDG